VRLNRDGGRSLARSLAVRNTWSDSADARARLRNRRASDRGLRTLHVRNVRARTAAAAAAAAAGAVAVAAAVVATRGGLIFIREIAG